MKQEMLIRKWAYSLVIILLEWGLLSSTALAYTYGQFQPIGILLIVGAIITGFGAVFLWTKVLRDRLQPNPRNARKIRLALNFVYIVSLALIAGSSLTLGWKYIAAARPTAFTIFRVSTIGLIILLLAFMVIIGLWQYSLKSLEQSES
jgi:H+/Cl- antiporter ClcA